MSPSFRLPRHQRRQPPGNLGVAISRRMLAAHRSTRRGVAQATRQLRERRIGLRDQDGAGVAVGDTDGRHHLDLTAALQQPAHAIRG